MSISKLTGIMPKVAVTLKCHQTQSMSFLMNQSRLALVLSFVRHSTTDQCWRNKSIYNKKSSHVLSSIRSQDSGNVYVTCWRFAGLQLVSTCKASLGSSCWLYRASEDVERWLTNILCMVVFIFYSTTGCSVWGQTGHSWSPRRRMFRTDLLQLV